MLKKLTALRVKSLLAKKAKRLFGVPQAGKEASEATNMGREYRIPSHSDAVKTAAHVRETLTRLADRAPEEMRAELDQALKDVCEVESYLKRLGIIESGG